MGGSDEEMKPARRRMNGLAGGILIGLLVGLGIGVLQGDLIEGLSFGLVIGLAIGAGLEGRGQMMQYHPGAVRLILFAAGLFLVSLLITFQFIERVPDGIGKILLALLPAAAFLLFVMAIGWAISGLDELQRRIQTEAIAVGFGFAGVVVFAVGLLEQVGMEQPNWSYAGLPMVLGWGLGKAWTLWKYR
jgi:hypothetical protein